MKKLFLAVAVLFAVWISYEYGYYVARCEQESSNSTKWRIKTWAA